jgi:O-antigen/teichoic acid export membrane protein
MGAEHLDSTDKSAIAVKYSLVAQGISIVINLVRTFIFTLFIAPEHFGLIALSASFTGLIQLLKDFGYSTYIVQQKELNEKELIFINSRSLFLGLIAFLITCVVSLPISDFYQNVELLWILPLTGLQFLLNSFTLVPIALLRRKMEFEKVGKIEVMSNLFSFIFSLLLLLFIRTYWVLLVCTLLYFLFQIVLSIRYSHWVFKLCNPFSKAVDRKSTAFGSKLTAFNVLTFVSYNIDNLVIGKLAGNSVLGIYSKSYEFGVTNVDKLRRPIHLVYFSDISRKKPEERVKLFFQYTFLLISMLLLLVGPLLIYLNRVIPAFFGESWNGLTSMLPPFFLCSFIWITMSFADQLLIVAPNLKRYLILGGSKAIFGCIAILISSIGGAVAISWSYLFYHVLVFIPFCYSIFRGINLTNSDVKSSMSKLIVAVTSAVFTVLIPWALIQVHIITDNTALILFIALVVTNYKILWSRLPGFEPFKYYLKVLFRGSHLRNFQRVKA